MFYVLQSVFIHFISLEFHNPMRGERADVTPTLNMRNITYRENEIFVGSSGQYCT